MIEDIELAINEYFKSIENSDSYICECGCKSELPLDHFLLKVVKNDINRILIQFKGLKQ